MSLGRHRSRRSTGVLKVDVTGHPGSREPADSRIVCDNERALSPQIVGIEGIAGGPIFWTQLIQIGIREDPPIRDLPRPDVHMRDRQRVFGCHGANFEHVTILARRVRTETSSDLFAIGA